MSSIVVASSPPPYGPFDVAPFPLEPWQNRLLDELRPVLTVDLTPARPAYESSPEYHALLSAIAAAPLDDLPKLVFADWIEEHGDDRRARELRQTVALHRTMFDASQSVMKAFDDAIAELCRSRAN